MTASITMKGVRSPKRKGLAAAHMGERCGQSAFYHGAFSLSSVLNRVFYIVSIQMGIAGRWEKDFVPAREAW